MPEKHQERKIQSPLGSVVYVLNDIHSDNLGPYLPKQFDSNSNEDN